MPSYLDIQRLRARQPVARQPVGQELLAPTPEGPNIFEAAGAGFKTTNLVSQAVAVWNRKRPEDRTPDPNWNPATYLRENPDYQWILDLTRQDEDAFEAILSTINESDLLALIQNQEQVMNEHRAFAAHPVAGVTGAVAGVIADLPMLLVPGAGLARGLATTAKTMNAARRIGAFRLGAIGAGENAAFEAIASKRDITKGWEEIAFAGAVGGALGGVIGGVAPKSVGVSVSPAMRAASQASEATNANKLFSRGGARTERPEAQVPVEEPQLRSVGAAAVGDEVDPTLGQFPRAAPIGGQTIRKYVPFSAHFTSVKSRWLTLSEQFKDSQGVRDFVGQLGRFVRYEAVQKGEMEGVSVRGDTVQEISQRYMGAQWFGKLQTVAQDEYSRLAEDLSDGFMRKRAQEPVFRARGNFIRRLSKRGLNKTEFRKLTTWWTLFEQNSLDSEKVFQKFLPSDIRPEELNRVRQAVKRVAEETDDVMRRAWDEWYEAGLVETPEPPMAWHLPQMWNREGIQADENMFLDVVKHNMELEPPEPWLIQQGLLSEGQKFSDLDTAGRAAAEDEWAFFRAEEIRDKAEAALNKAKGALTEAEDEAVDAAMARYDRLIEAQSKKVRVWEEKLATAKTNDADEFARRNLIKAETRYQKLLDEAESAQDALRTRDNLLEGLNDAIRRTKNRTERARLLKARTGLSKAEKKTAAAQEQVAAGVDEAEVDPDILARGFAKGLRRTMEEEENIHGFATRGIDEIGFAGKTSHQHPRVINLRRSIASFDDRLYDLLEMDPDTLLHSYFSHMGPRAALAKTFGTTDVEEAFQPLIEALPDATLRREAAEDVRALTDRLLGRHLARSPDARWFSSLFRNFNVASFLQMSLLSQTGDVGIAHAALGTKNVRKTLSRAARAFAPGKPMHKAMEQMSNPQLKALIYGYENTAAMVGRTQKLTEMDPTLAKRGVGPIGSPIYHMTRKLYTASEMTAQGVMELNLMNRWHKTQTAAFRYAAFQQLVEFGEKGWDSIDEVYQGVLRSRGVGPKELNRIFKRFQETKTELEDGIAFPDLNKWNAEDFTLLERAVDTASSSAVIAPTLGDLPRGVNNPLGAMFFQFTGFSYSAQMKFLTRFQQNPMYGPNLHALFMSATFVLAANAARAHLLGRSQEWSESWETPEGVTQNMYEMFTRSPFAVAWTTAATELALSQFARPSNALLEKAGLPPLVPGVSRFQERQGLARAMGPSWTTAERFMTLGREGANALTGDEAAQESFQKTLARTLPGAGLAKLYMLDAVLGEKN